MEKREARVARMEWGWGRTGEREADRVGCSGHWKDIVAGRGEIEVHWVLLGQALRWGFAPQKG